MYFQQSAKAFYSGFKFKDAASQEAVLLRFLQQMSGKTGLKIVGFDKGFGYQPAFTAGSAVPLMFHLGAGNGIAAFDDVGQDFVCIGNQRIKFMQNKAVF